VFTSLTKEALPIIRYRTRDLTCLLPGTARTMRRMAKITGRTDDMLIIRGVNVFPSQIEEQILKEEALSAHYQLEVSREGSLDTLAVLCELEPAKGGMSPAEREALAKHLRDKIKGYIGVSSRVHVLDVGAVPRSEGKAVRVVDKRA